MNVCMSNKCSPRSKMPLSQQSQWMESYILVKHVDGRYLHGASMVIWLHYICGLDFQDAYASAGIKILHI